MKIEDWGLIEYQSAVERQLAAVEAVSGGAEELIVLCNHPPVVTLGRGSTPEDLIGWRGATVETSRGGRATYHGPSQIVIYPIVDLRRAQPERDVHVFLRKLEDASVMCLRETGLPDVEVRTAKVGELSLTGVWRGPKKIASIGIAVRKWVTYHGVAINVLSDPSAFQGIRPCGFQTGVMTSVEAELGRAVDLSELKSMYGQIFAKALA